MRVISPAHLIFPLFDSDNNILQITHTMELLINLFYSLASYFLRLLDPNTFLSALHSNALNLCFSFRVKD
jgi:hypothetical protein